jgi:hypothetical protein
MDFVASMPGSKSRYSGVRRAKRARFIPALTYPGLDELFDVCRHEMQAAEVPVEGLREATPGEVVANSEAIEIEIKNTLLVGVGWIAHPDIGIEASRSLC